MTFREAIHEIPAPFLILLPFVALTVICVIGANVYLLRLRYRNK